MKGNQNPVVYAHDGNVYVTWNNMGVICISISLFLIMAGNPRLTDYICLNIK